MQSPTWQDASVFTSMLSLLHAALELPSARTQVAYTSVPMGEKIWAIDLPGSYLTQF